MAGKVKKKDEGGVQSKTARASMRGAAAKGADYIPSGDVSRIVPLGGGTYAYVLDPRNGRTLKMAVKSEQFVEVLGALAEAGHGDRMNRDLAELAVRYPSGGWADAQKRLQEALAPVGGGEDAEEA